MTMNKICDKCNTTKPISEFGKRKNAKDGLQPNCLVCTEIAYKDRRNKWMKNWRSNNPEKQKKYRDIWIKNNSEKYKEYQKKYYERNPSILEKTTERWNEWIKNNPEKYKEYQKKYRKSDEWRQKNKEKNSEYYQKNKEKKNDKHSEYYQKNKEKINENLKKYVKKRRKDDILFKLSSNYRSRLSFFYKNSKIKKIQKTNDVIGCSWSELHKHIESKFQDGMSNDNYGDWHIDHIIPLISAKNEEELIKLCHYSNLQPLWAKDNRSKKDRIL